MTDAPASTPGTALGTPGEHAGGVEGVATGGAPWSLRGSWSTRGVALGAGGISAAVAAAVLGEPDLVRLGVFVGALPLLSIAWTLLVLERGCRGLVARRTALPTHASAGTPVTVTLRLTRPAGRVGTVLAEDLLPAGVSRRAEPPRLVLGSGETEASTTYTLVPLRRGTLLLGPTLVRPSSPLGLCDRRGELSETTEIVVAPRVVPLAVTSSLRQPHEIGEHRPKRPGSAPAEDASLRPYRRGDDLRLVHWRSSARRGELQVRDGVELRIPRSVVLLDDVGPAGLAFETAVDLAASVGVHLLGLDHDLDLVAPTSLTDPRRVRHADALLDRLADVHATPVDAGSRRAADKAAGGVSARVRVGVGDVLVLCTRLDADVDALARWLPTPPPRCPAMAFVAGTATPPAELEELLVARGWVTRGVPTTEDLPRAWREDAPRAVVVSGGGR